MLNDKKLIPLLLFLVLATFSQAQQNEDDTSCIQPFDRKYCVQFNTWLTDVDLVVNPRRQKKNYAIKLQPNVKGQAGVAFGFKRFTIAMGFQLPGTQSDENRFGKTAYYDFSFGYFKRKFGGEIYYRYFQGMLRAANDFSENAKRPDIFLSNGGLNFFYARNYCKFSMRSAIAQQEQQIKPAGSFIILSNIQFRTVRADSSIIAPGIDEPGYFPELSGLKQMRFFTLSIRPGYAYNFLGGKGRWFFSPSAYAGPGTGWYSSVSNRGLKRGIPLDVAFHSKTLAGYNHKRWFACIFYIYDGSMNVFKSSFVTLNTHSFGLNLGYRINSIGIKWL